jgi:hypothetical protein
VFIAQVNAMYINKEISPIMRKEMQFPFSFGGPLSVQGQNFALE